METVSAGERAARLRAIRGYSGLNQDHFAKILNVSVTTLSRLENARAGAPSMRQLRTVADACGVPQAFAEEGFTPLEIDLSRTDHLALEAIRRLDEIEDWIRQSADAGGPAPQGELRRRLRERETTGRSPDAGDSQADEGDQRGIGG